MIKPISGAVISGVVDAPRPNNLIISHPLLGHTIHRPTKPVPNEDACGSRKGSDGRGLLKNQQEDHLRLITRFELAKLSTPELHILQGITFDALIRSDFGTAARRNALASLENIERELTLRFH